MLVLLAGHGANVVNNPYAGTLHCGACGGYAGEVNARLVAMLMNDAEVRAGLPWQSVHDGAGYAHDPLRLTVCMETPREAISAILARQGDMRVIWNGRPNTLRQRSLSSTNVWTLWARKLRLLHPQNPPLKSASVLPEIAHSQWIHLPGQGQS